MYARTYWNVDHQAVKQFAMFQKLHLTVDHQKEAISRIKPQNRTSQNTFTKPKPATRLFLSYGTNSAYPLPIAAGPRGWLVLLLLTFVLNTVRPTYERSIYLVRVIMVRAWCSLLISVLSRLLQNYVCRSYGMPSVGNYRSHLDVQPKAQKTQLLCFRREW